MATETVVLVLTDVAGSTRLWTDFPDEMNDVMARHHEIVHAAVATHGGWRPVDQGEGDAVFAAFGSASAAIGAVVEFQRLLETEAWPAGIEVRDRVGVHLGEVTIRDGNLFGLPVARAARIRSLGAGGQVLLSAPVVDLVRDSLAADLVLTDLGEHRMKDLARPEHVFELSGAGMAAGFPPLPSLDRSRTNLPVQATEFFGREAEVAELSALVPTQRLTTIVGFGGMGKTRLALQVAAGAGDGFVDGVWFVDLAAVTDVGRVPEAIATGAGGGQGVSALEPLLAWLRPRRTLLVLDNLEQLLPDAAAIVDRIVAEAPEVRILATSREAIRIRGERVFGLEPLPVPDADEDTASFGRSAAVALFLDRAAAVRRDFALTPANSASVALICRRLEGLPLALELAAARLRALSPEALLPRLEHALSVLTSGSRDLPARQRTLRATIAWSFDALSDDEQSVLLRLSVFPATFDLAAAEEVADGDDLDVLNAVTGLVDRSVLRLHAGAGLAGEDRYDLLVSIRDFAREQLELRHGADEAAERHASWTVRLCTELRRRIDDGDDRAILGFRAEAANIDAALIRLLADGDAGVGDAKRLMVAARSTYLGFLPYVVLHQRLQQLPRSAFRGGALDTEVIGLALTIGYFLELPDERRTWLDLGFRLCDTDPDAQWSRAARMSFLMEESELLLLARDFETARAVTLRCLEEAHLLHAVDVEAAALNQLVDMTEYEGDPGQGLIWATRYVAFIEQHRIVVRRVYARLSIVHALLELGRVEEAAEAWATAAGYAEAIGSPHNLCWLRTYEGMIELAHGRIDAAIAAFDAAEEHLHRYPVPEGHHVLQQARIGVHAARGDWPEVDRMLAAMPSPSELGFPVSPLPLQVRMLLDGRPPAPPVL